MSDTAYLTCIMDPSTNRFAFDTTISRAILSMDSQEQLPIDMVEQLLKFTPSAEERALLDEHSEDIDSLARADRFLYEISK